MREDFTRVLSEKLPYFGPLCCAGHFWEARQPVEFRVQPWLAVATQLFPVVP